MTSIDNIKAAFAADRYAALSGIEVVACTDTTATCSMHITPNHTNARGVVMGGALFTLADFAAAVAANAKHIDATELQWVSLTSTINYLRPATTGPLVAVCSAVKQGRTTALFHTTITNPQGAAVASVETTMIHI